VIKYFSEVPSSKESGQHGDPSTLIRRVLFSRSLRLLPLPQQVGVVEALASIIKTFPSFLRITDPQLTGGLAELLKMSSVADGEMVDEKLKEMVVDRDGYMPSATAASSEYPTHASALFFRRECVIDVGKVKIVVPEELPAGVQLRVSTVKLLHLVVRTHSDPFFDAEPTTTIGTCVNGLMFLLLMTWLPIFSHPPHLQATSDRML